MEGIARYTVLGSDGRKERECIIKTVCLRGRKAGFSFFEFQDEIICHRKNSSPFFALYENIHRE